MAEYGMLLDTEWSPARNKDFGTWKDQHGRTWGAEIEKATMMPCGRLRPMNWGAPWLPDVQYLRLTTDSKYDRTLTIDYDALLTDLARAHEEWTRDIENRMALRHKEAYRPSMSPDSDILRQVGPKPPALEVAVAAKQGEPWVLGLSNRVHPELYALLNPAKETAQGFLARALAKDYTNPQPIPEASPVDAAYIDEEEAADAEALGGKTVAVRRRGRPPKSRTTEE